MANVKSKIVMILFYLNASQVMLASAVTLSPPPKHTSHSYIATPDLCTHLTCFDFY